LQKLNHPDKSEVFTALDGINIAVDNRNCLTLEIPAISKEKIITNDIVELTGSNQFCWKGRFDNVINSGGVKINPENIERAVEKVAHDLLIKAQFIIAGVDDAKLGQKIILICDSDLDASQQENILSGLSKKLSAFEIPRTIYFVVPFIYTNTGKIDRIKTIKQITSAPTSN